MSLSRDRSTIGKLRAHVAMLERRISYATDKQLLLLNKLILAGDDAKGKRCPGCDEPLVELRSMELRVCCGCGTEQPWPLHPGQQPLLGSNRSVTRQPLLPHPTPIHQRQDCDAQAQ